ncbi:hydroxyacid dehydrogenase [Spongiactinospora sp. TRM90649]|uniref:hydroxyacid dehydrogenase n=1 Tax=Spongiactinospora sp. TRM90649 TaxID=3031114 RepID=UPI0023F75877|nr:hydroxyacid dehydrogenase [Spongiactinospora sp. TRM90649]MDF5754176.1 hydroxyacid dehydrogenase [Spongiactinospora sp. TRM90649]
MLTAAFVLDPAVFADVYGPSLDRLRRTARPIYGPVARADPGRLGGIEVLCTGWGAPVLDRAFLDAAPGLALVLHAAGSVRGLVTPEFWERGIPLVSAYRANAVPVADFTAAQIVYALKQGWRHVLLSRERRGPVGHLPAPGTYGTRVGLVSLGAIGRLVASRLRPLDVEVVAHDPYADPATAGVPLVGLGELFGTCDVVSLHTPLLPETAGMVGRELLRGMREGATLINTARGGLIDETALIEVLAERPDLFAVLDVTDPEPPPPGSPLFTLPNVVVTPHIAGSLGRERARLGALVTGELERFAAGLPLEHALTGRTAERLA